MLAPALWQDWNFFFFFRVARKLYSKADRQHRSEICCQECLDHFSHRLWHVPCLPRQHHWSPFREHGCILFLVISLLLCDLVLSFLCFCPLQPIINGYRNKSTFSVNRSPDGNPKTVGYYLGTWKGQLKAKQNRQTHKTVMAKGEEDTDNSVNRSGTHKDFKES